MAIKINTAYGERLTSGMLNEKISNLVGGNEKLSGFDVAIASPTSVTIKPGKAIVNGCAIEETSETRTLTLEQEILSVDGIAYVVLNYIHETKSVIFSCVNSVANTMVKLATLFIKDGVISELTNHTTTKTLSTVVAEAAEIEAQKIRDSIPSGFVELGELDYDYMLNNENKIKIKSESVAYVNGYRIEIPADTVIDIGKAPEKELREDLLFLEAWKDSDFAKSGKLKWRIRHVADVDFNVTPEGFPPNYDFGYENRNTYIFATPQGANTSPIDVSLLNQKIRMFSKANSAPRVTNNFNPSTSANGDIGLYIAGAKGEEQYLKPIFKTADGFVYAIPMFRLYRKPSCGKSIPFEYSKINPKVDYNKFTKLMKEDKVERVVTENIQGRSLVNFAYATSITLTKNLYSPLTRDGLIKSNKEYTLSFNISKITGSAIGKLLRLIIRPTGGSDDTSNDVNINVTSSSFTTGKVKVKIPSQTVSIARLYIHLNGGANVDSIALTDVTILEDDWTNKEMPTSFSGLKSLGEDDGSLITLKNGILSDDTYDINDGNQKLVSFPEVTHVSSTNSLIPKVEANVIKGEEITPLEKLGTKLVTDGTEVIEFTKIKGRTLQNLFGADLPNIQDSASRLQCSNVKNKDMYVSGTYTLVNLSDKMIIPNEYEGSTYIKQLPCQPKSKTLVTLESGRSIQEVIAKYSDGWTSNDLNYFLNSLLILKGDYTTTSLEDLPYVEGIKSIGELENNVVNLTSVGKNLISKDMYTNNWFMGDSVDVDRYDTTGKLYSIYGIKTFGRKPLTLSCNKPFNRMVFRGKDSSGNIIYQGDLGTISKTSHVFNDIPSEVVTLDLYVHSKGIDYTYDFMLEEGKVVNPYEPYKGYNQNIYLKEPLRSLPSGVCDEIVGNKVIRRVGKTVLDGSNDEFWSIHISNWVLEGSTVFSPGSNVFPNAKGYVWGTYSGSFAISDVFPSYGDIYLRTTNVLGFTNDNTQAIKRFRVPNSLLASPDVNGFTTWLSQNPTTVYYELANPIEEYLENVYEKESIKTYQLDTPLRSLPNGVKDEIKDGVLIRRCGEIILDGSSDEIYKINNSIDNYSAYYLQNTPSNYKHSSKLLCDKMKQSDYLSDELGLFTSIYAYIYIKIPKDITPNEYLNSNPIKVIYELATPVEIPLTEAKPQNANFSLQRQFGEGNWLRELPNGVKDTVENGKVIRRVGKLVIDSSVVFTTHRNTEDYYEYRATVAGLPTITVLTSYSNNFPQTENHRIVNRDVVYVRFPASMGITTPELCNQWFLNNKTVLLYQLANTIEEVLSTNNYMPYPCHEINTYCGSMYVGQGRNHVENENKMPSEDVVIVDTPFRSIEGQSKVEDCRYKKQADGYNTKYLSSGSNNLVNIKNVNPHIFLVG